MKNIYFLLFIVFYAFSGDLIAQVPSYVPSNGLVGWWPFDGNANDESGNGNNGIVYGAVLTSDRFNSVSSAFYFNNNKIEIPHNSNLGFAQNQGFSVSVWAKKDVGISTTHLMGKRPNGAQSFNWHIADWVGTQFSSTSSTNVFGAISNQPLSTVVWTHIVGIYESGLWKLYMDGILISSSVSSFFYPDVNTPLVIGNSGNWGGFYGSLDDIGIWSRALTDCEVQQLYSSQVQTSSTVSAGPDQTVCAGSPVTLTATGASTYSWSGGVQNGVSFVPTTSTSYIVTGTNSSGCSGADTVMVTVVPAPVISASEDTICAGQSTTLTASITQNTCSVPTGTLATGLVGYWPFCGNANDESGNGNHGTVNGATLTTDRFGNLSSAYSFDGLDDFIYTNIVPVVGSNNRTVSFFLKAESTPASSDYACVSWGGNSPSCSQAGLDFECNIFDFGGIKARIDGTCTANYTNSSIDLNWHMITYVVDNSLGNTFTSVQIYIDGVLASTAPYNGSTTINTTNLATLIFGNSNKINRFLHGKLDDIGIWNRALTASEIQQLYTLGQATYSWTPGGATTSSITVSPSTTTIYTCEVTNSSGTTCSATQTITVNSIAVSAGPDQSICAGSPVTLTATGASSYSWSGGVQNGVSFVPTTSTSYIVTGNNSSGCSGADTVMVTVVPAPVISASEDTICTGQSTTLTASITQNSCSVPSGTLATGLVGYWPFCGNYSDLSQNVNNGSPINGASLSTDRFGNNSNALNLDGIDDYLSLDNQLPDCSVFTISLWAYHTKGASFSGILSDATTSSGNDLYFNLNESSIGIKADKNGTSLFQCPLPEVGYNPAPISSGLNLGNQWSHISLIVESNLTRVYVNSSLVATLNIGGSNVGFHALHPVFGKITDGDYSIQYFGGKLDDIGIWNRALTASEIQQLYTLGQGTYSWTPGGATTSSITVSPSTTATYTCEVTNSNGTTCSATQTITVNSISVSAGPDQSVCAGSPVTLTATGASTYSWTGGVQNGVSFVPTTSASYIVTGTNSNGCSGADTVMVTVVPTPVISASEDTICTGQSTTLTASITQNSCSVPSGTLATGLVGYWPFCGNANDESGNGNHGTVNGATLTTDRFGNSNNAYSFDGVNDFIQCVQSGISGGQSKTVSFWIKDGIGSGHVFSYGGNGTSGNDFRVLINPYGSCSSSVAFDIYNSGIGYVTTFNNTWDNYVVVYNSSSSNTILSCEIYKNGILLVNNCFNLTTVTPNFLTDFPVTFGRYHGTIPTDYLNGTLDDIAFWNRALTTSEIQQLYSLGQATYSWTPGGAMTSSITVSPSTTTTYTCEVTNSNGTTCSATQTITVNSIAVSAGPDQTVCAGSPVTLTATGASSYSWSGGVQNGVSFIPSVTDTLVVTGTNASSCTGQDTVVINVLPTPVITAQDSVICSGDTTTLTASSIGIGSSTSCTGTSPVNYTTWTPIAPADSYTNIIKEGATYYLRSQSNVFQSSSLVGPWSSMNFNNQFSFSCAGEMLGMDQLGRLHISSCHNGIFYFDNGSWVNNGFSGFGTAGQYFTLLSSGRVVISKGGFQRSIYYSDNNGASWNNATNVDVDYNHITAAQNGHLFACSAIGGTGLKGVIKSEDNGSSWSSINTLLGITTSTAIYKDCQNNLWVVGDNKLLKSVDNGLSWTQVSLIPSFFNSNPYYGQFVAASNGTLYYYGWMPSSQYGLYSSTDQGNTWVLEMITSEVYRLREIDGNIIAATNQGVYAKTLTQAPTYTWSTGATTQTISVNPTQTTTYTVTVDYGNGNGILCSSSFTVNVNATPNVIAGPDQTICAGSPVTLTATGASSYSWSGGVQNGVSFTPATSGSYVVTGTNAAGCTGSDTVIVSVLPNVNVNGGPDQSICAGSPVTLTATGASTYSWSGGIQNGVSFIPSVTDTLVVTGTNASGCTGQDTVVINVLPTPVITAQDSVICSGDTTTLTASSIGIGSSTSCTGTSPVNYTTWTPIAPADSYTNIIKEGATYYLRSQSNVFQSSSLVGPWSSMNFNTQIGNTLAGRMLGTDWSNRLVVSTGHNSLYAYNNGTWQDIGLGGFGCGGNFIHKLANNRIIVMKAGYLRDLYISDNNAVSYTNVTNVDNDYWDMIVAPNGNIYACGGSNTPSMTGLIKSTNNGSSFSQINAQLGISFCSGFANDCAGNIYAVADNKIFKSVDGNTWSQHATIPTYFTSNPWYSFLVIGSNGDYYYWGYNSPGLCALFKSSNQGLTWSQVTDLGVPAVDIYSLKEIDGNIIAATNQGVYAKTLTQAPTYTWSTGATTQTISVNPTQTTTYTVTVDYGNGILCSSSFTVNVNATPNVIAGPDQSICTGSPVTLTATGALNLSWTGGVQNGVPFIPTSSGLYTVTGTSSNGCLGTDLVTITVLSNPVISSAVSNVLCNGAATGAIALSISGGASPYITSWGNGQSGLSLQNLLAGFYSVTVSDANNCTQQDTILIQEPLPLSLTAQVSPANCSNIATGAIDLTVSGGVTPYNVLWSTGATSQDLLNLNGGTYCVQVTDLNGCIANDTFQINQSTAIQLLSTVINPSCSNLNNGQIDISIAGGTPAYSYTWSNGQSTQDLVGVGAGNFSLTVTDAFGCNQTATFNLTAPTPLNITFNTNTIGCYGAATGQVNSTVTGGVQPYSYFWSNGATTPNISNVVAGNYTLTVNDAGGCTFSASSPIQQPTNPLIITASVSPINCNGASTGLIDISVSGGTMFYSYAWSNGAISQDLQNVSAGNYTLILTDGNGCVYDSSFSISQPAQPLSSQMSQVNLFCQNGNNGFVNLTVSGGVQPYTYQWSNGPTTQDIFNLTAGTYSVVITDAIGCQINDTVTITQPAIPFTLTGTIGNVSCFGGASGTIVITVTGGNPTYSYVWSNGASTQDLANIPAGNYNVVVFDSQGCQTSQSFTITQPSFALQANAVVSNLDCATFETGGIDVSVYGGNAPYTYQWSTGANTEDLNNLGAGTYSVSITDQNGCQIILTETISAPSQPLLTTSVVQNVTCFGLADGQIDLNTTGGVGPYSVIWANGMTTMSIDSLNAGTYEAVVTDANGCENELTIQVSQPAALVPLFYSSAQFACIPDTIHFSYPMTDPNLSYAWDFGNGQTSNQQNPSVVFDNVGCFTVSLTVSSNNGCTIDIVSDSLVCTVQGPSAAFYSTTNSINYYTGELNLFDNSEGSISSYLWSFGDASPNSTEMNPIHYYPQYDPQSYLVQLTVTDSNGCQDTAEYLYELIEDFNVYVPNTITVNGDQFNEGFLPVFSNVDLLKSYEIEIFNRWGQLVWSSDQPAEAWYGRYKDARDVQLGVYTWKIKYTDNKSVTRTIAGHVNVIR